jgi:hypothetical protein
MSEKSEADKPQLLARTILLIFFSDTSLTSNFAQLLYLEVAD